MLSQQHNMSLKSIFLSLSTAVSPLSQYDRWASWEEKGGFHHPLSLSCSALLFCHIVLISVERAKDEPVLLDYSAFSLISFFTMGLSFTRSKERREIEGGKKQYNLCTKTGGRQNESENERRKEESLTDREVKRKKKTLRMQCYRKISNPDN